MNKLGKDKGKVLGIVIIFAIIFVGSYIWRTNRLKDIELSGVYTVGMIINKRSTLKNKKWWRYEFYYNGERYIDKTLIKEKYAMKVGEGLIVKFDPENPNNSIIFYEYIVADPPQIHFGKIWDTLPRSIILPRNK